MLQFVGLIGFPLVSSCFEPGFKTSPLLIFFFTFLKKLPIIVLSVFLLCNSFSEPVCCVVVLFVSISFFEVRFYSSFLLLLLSFFFSFFFFFGVGINHGNFLIFSPFLFVFVLDLLGV